MSVTTRTSVPSGRGCNGPKSQRRTPEQLFPRAPVDSANVNNDANAYVVGSRRSIAAITLDKFKNNEEEEKRTKFIRQVYQMVYEYKFEELLNLLNTNYPSFANKNQNIIYILLKFNFIKIILHQHDFSAAKEFYSNHLFLMMKKIYRDKSHSFYKKNFKYNCFLNQINSSLSKFIYFQNHFKFENHLDKFMTLFEKSLEKKQRSEKNPVIFNITKAKTNQNNKSI